MKTSRARSACRLVRHRISRRAIVRDQGREQTVDRRREGQLRQELREGRLGPLPRHEPDVLVAVAVIAGVAYAALAVYWMLPAIARFVRGPLV